MTPSQKNKVLQSLVWLLPALAIILLMVFAPTMESLVCPRGLKASNGCGQLFPLWAYGVCILMVLGLVGRTAWTCYKVLRGDDYELDRMTGQDRYKA